jgi:hypothetical protein
MSPRSKDPWWNDRMLTIYNKIDKLNDVQYPNIRQKTGLDALVRIIMYIVDVILGAAIIGCVILGPSKFWSLVVWMFHYFVRI